MRLLTSFAFIFCIGTTTWAQTATTKSGQSQMTYQEARQKLKGFSVLAYYNFANKSPLKIGQETINAKNNETLGFGVQYQYSLTPYLKNKAPLSVIGGLIYETERQIEALNVSGTQFKIDGQGKPAFSLFLLTGNMDYQFTKEASVFAGLNFPLPSESNFGEVQLDGTIGYQAGLTLAITPSFGADVSYRWINLTGNNGLNRVDVEGLLMKGRYIF